MTMLLGVGTLVTWSKSSQPSLPLKLQVFTAYPSWVVGTALVGKAAIHSSSVVFHLVSPVVGVQLSKVVVLTVYPSLSLLLVPQDLFSNKFTIQKSCLILFFNFLLYSFGFTNNDKHFKLAMVACI
jgi:hypothetical protein